MSEAIGTTAAANGAGQMTSGMNVTLGDAPMTTAGADSNLPMPALAVHPVVQAVVTSVQATNPPSNWAMTAASVLQALMPVIQPAEQVGRASVRTQGEIAIGVAALSALLQVFFPHPQA